METKERAGWALAMMALAVIVGLLLIGWLLVPLFV